MTRALSIPPDAAARMMMLVSHDNKSRRSREPATLDQLDSPAKSSRNERDEDPLPSATTEDSA